MGTEFTVDDMSCVQNSRIPDINIGYDVRGASQGIRVSQRICCFIGTLDTAATAEPNTLYDIVSLAQAEELFGKDSNITQQISAALAVFRNGTYCAVAMDEINLSSDSNAPDFQPDFEAMFCELKTRTVHILSYPYEINGNAESATLLKAYLELVGNPIEQRPAIAVSAFVGNLITPPNYPIANNKRIAYVNALDCDQSKEHICGAVAAAILRSTHPAVPLNGVSLRLTGTKSFLRSECDVLLRRGVTPLQINAAKNLEIVRLISTETGGTSEELPDMWIRSLDYIREAMLGDLRHCFDGRVLTDESAESVRSVIIGCLKKLEEEDVVKNVDANVDLITVAPNTKKRGFLTASIPADIVIGLHGMDGMINMLLS